MFGSTRFFFFFWKSEQQFYTENFQITVLYLPVYLQASYKLSYIQAGSLFRMIKSKIYIKLEGVKLRFPLTWFKCTIARSYALCTDLRTLGFLPSIKRSLSTVSSIPKRSSLFRGSHCLKTSETIFKMNKTSLIYIHHKVELACLDLTKFFWCQRRAPRIAWCLLPFPSTLPVWVPPQEALE